VLLPAVRAAAPETLIVADGFSCREQIAQTTDRRALHLAQLLQMALYERSDDPVAEPASNTPKSRVRNVAIAGGLLAGVALVWRAGKHRLG
jgi:hypothetical protein